MIDYSPIGKKDFKFDQVVHALKETKRFLQLTESPTDLLGLMEKNRICSKLLKLMNDALEIMLNRKRESLLQVSNGITGPIRPKITSEKAEKIKKHEIEANKKLIDILTDELERLSDVKSTLANPG